MTTSPRFDAYFDWLIPHEAVFERGHYGDLAHVVAENDPDDPGGLTKWGIDRRSHPGLDIESLTLQDAKEVYWRSYWLAAHGDEWPAGYGEVLTDIRVNGGDGVRMLQRALNDLGETPPLALDGAFGPKTLAAAEAADGGLRLLLRARDARYRRLADDPHLSKFLRGWLARNASLARFVGFETWPA